VRTQDGRLRLVDVVGGTVRPDITAPGVRGECGDPYLNMTAGRRYLVTGCASCVGHLAPGECALPALVWNLTNGRPVWTGPAGGDKLGIDPTGTTLVRARPNGTVEAVDLASGQVRTATRGHESRVSAVAWLPNAHAFATTSADRTVILWDTSTLQPTATLRGHTGPIVTAATSTDSARLYTAGWDNTVFAWDLNGRDRVARPVPVATASTETSDFHKVNRASTLMVSLYPDAGLLEINDLTREDGAGSYTITGSDLRGGGDLDIDNAGKVAAVMRQDPTSGALTVRIFDLAARQFRPFTITLEGNSQSPGASLALSGDGRSLTTFDTSRFMRRWNTADGSPQDGPTYRAASTIGFAERSPDGRMLALAGQTETVDIVDLGTRRRVTAVTVTGARELSRPAFAPDGRHIALGTRQGEIAIADTATGQVHRRWPAAAGPIKWLAFTPDGRYLVSAATDGKAALWSVEAGPIGGTILDIAHSGATIGVVVLDARHVLTINPGEPTLLWDIDPDNLLTHACTIAGRNLTHDEWTGLMPQRPYQRTCPQYR
jgi:WD40 repeat protein